MNSKWMFHQIYECFINKDKCSPQWRWTLMVFAMSFISSWLTFATVWFVIALLHGDLDLQLPLPDRGNHRWGFFQVSVIESVFCGIFCITHHGPQRRACHRWDFFFKYQASKLLGKSGFCGIFFCYSSRSSITWTCNCRCPIGGIIGDIFFSRIRHPNYLVS